MLFVYAVAVGTLLGTSVGAIVARMPLPALARTICAVTTTSLVGMELTFSIFQRLFPEMLFGYWLFEPAGVLEGVFPPLIAGAIFHWATGWLLGSQRSDVYRLVAASCAAGLLTALRLALEIYSLRLPI